MKPKPKQKPFRPAAKYRELYVPYTKRDLKKYYRSILPRLREIALEHGYAVAVHGSMTRDLDIMAMPWVKEAKAPESLAMALMREFMVFSNGKNGTSYTRQYFKENSSRSNKPHGRLAYSIPCKGKAYIDLSCMPRK